MKTSPFYIYLVLLSFAVISCNPNSSEPANSTSFIPEKSSDELLNKVSDEGRLVWQKPEEVLQLLGDISGLTIADIGAGAGYFTFRFAMKADKVIAIDIDPTMIQILESFRQKLPLEIQEKIETRLATPSNPMIKKEEADIIAIINTIGYIENRETYIRNLKPALKENGKLLLLDFKSKNMPINAPPMQYRVPLGTLENELTRSGFTILTSDDRTLDYQYIIIAGK